MSPPYSTFSNASLFFSCLRKILSNMVDERRLKHGEKKYSLPPFRIIDTLHVVHFEIFKISSINPFRAHR